MAVSTVASAQNSGKPLAMQPASPPPEDCVEQNENYMKCGVLPNPELVDLIDRFFMLHMTSGWIPTPVQQIIIQYCHNSHSEKYIFEHWYSDAPQVPSKMLAFLESNDNWKEYVPIYFKGTLRNIQATWLRLYPNSWESYHEELLDEKFQASGWGVFCWRPRAIENCPGLRHASIAESEYSNFFVNTYSGQRYEGGGWVKTFEIEDESNQNSTPIKDKHVGMVATATATKAAAAKPTMTVEMEDESNHNPTPTKK